MSLAIDEQLIAYLLADTGVSALVATRVHEGQVPQVDTFPYVWLERHTKEQTGGLTPRETQLVEQRFNVECVATSIASAQTLAEAVRASLHEKRGVLTGTEAAVQGVFVEDHSDDYLPRNSGEDEGLHIVSLDVSVFSGS